MKILVVGSGGFLGSHVTEKLQNNENYDVLKIVGKGQVDITNFDDLKLYLDSNNPEIVINCAAFVGGISY